MTSWAIFWRTVRVRISEATRGLDRAAREAVCAEASAGEITIRTRRLETK